MKLKSFLYGTFIFIAIIITIYLIAIIVPTFLSEGHVGISNGIAASKRIGVFNHEYVVEPETLKIDSTYTLRFGEAWAEKSWVHGNYFIPVKEPSREEWKGFTMYVQMMDSIVRTISFYEQYSVYTIEDDSTKNIFALTMVGGENSFLRSDFAKLGKNEMTIYIKERKTDTTEARRQTAFFTIRKK